MAYPLTPTLFFLKRIKNTYMTRLDKTYSNSNFPMILNWNIWRKNYHILLLITLCNQISINFHSFANNFCTTFKFDSSANKLLQISNFPPLILYSSLTYFGNPSIYLPFHYICILIMFSFCLSLTYWCWNLSF